MNRLTPAKVGLLVFGLALTFFWTLENTIGPGWAAWYRLEKFGQPAVATITGIRAEVHQRCSFKFTVAGVGHEGQDDGCSQLGIGAALQVTYLPTDPSFVSTRDPAGELLFEILAPLGLAVFGGVMTTWRISRRTRLRPT